MKKFLSRINILFVFTLLVAVHYTTAQTTQPFLKLNSIATDFKYINPGSQQLTFDEIKNLAKDPTALTELNLAGYHEGQYDFSIQSPNQIFFESPSGKIPTNSIVSSSRFDLFASFKMFSKKKGDYNKNRILRLGIFYQPYQYQQSNNVKTDTIATDTFLNHYAYYEAYTPLLGLDADYIFTTDADKWVSVYAGIGAAVGFSVHPQVAETYGTMKGIQYYDTIQDPYYPLYNFSVLSNTQNVYQGVSSMLLEAQIPVGINFRLAEILNIYFEATAVFADQFYLKGNSSFSNPINLQGAIGLQLNL
jgi:hypothetical protein